MNRSRRVRGFTIIECVLATFVLLSGFLAVMSVYPLSQRSASLSHNRTIALRVARNVLEAIRAHPYGDALASDVLADETYSEMVESAPTSVTFKKSVQYSTGGCVGSSSSTYDVVTVTVQWREGTGVGSAGQDKSVKVTGGVEPREP